MKKSTLAGPGERGWPPTECRGCAMKDRFLNVREAAVYLGGRSASWLRSHLADIPHLKLYDRLLFDPADLRAFVEKKAERRNPVDLDAGVASVLQHQRRRPRKETTE